MNVLFLNAESGMRDELRNALRRSSLSVDVTTSRNAVAWLRADRSYALVILDAAYPAAARADISRIRRYSNVPLLVLTQENQPPNRRDRTSKESIEYLATPCSPCDFLTHAWALISHAQGIEAGALHLADLTLDRTRGKAFRRGVDLDLSSTLFELLDVLMQHKGEVLSRAKLIKAAWGASSNERDNMVTVGILRLRQKLDEPFGLKLIHTVRSRGYVLELRKHWL